VKPAPATIATPRAIELIRAGQDALLATSRENRARRKVIADLCLACVEAINTGVDLGEADTVQWLAFLRHPSVEPPACYRPRLAALAPTPAVASPAPVRYRRPTLRELLIVAASLAGLATVAIRPWSDVAVGAPSVRQADYVEPLKRSVMPTAPIDRTYYRPSEHLIANGIPDCRYKEEETLDETLNRKSWCVKPHCNNGSAGTFTPGECRTWGYTAWRGLIDHHEMIADIRDGGVLEVLKAMDAIKPEAGK